MQKVPIIQAESFKDHSSLRFGMSTKVGGVSVQPMGMNLSFSVGDDGANVKRNRELFFGSLGIKLDELAVPRQIHSNTVRRADSPGSYDNCDALVTNRSRVFLYVSVADCVPIMVLDPRKRTIAAIHAGWRGTVAGIVHQTIAMMTTEFESDPADCLAYIGPSAGVCCYDVGQDVASQVEPQYIHRRSGKTYVDLKAANVGQLIRSGVQQTSIEVNPLCTISEASLLHSYRRDREKSGRMLAVIGFL